MTPGANPRGGPRSNQDGFGDDYVGQAYEQRLKPESSNSRPTGGILRRPRGHSFDDEYSSYSRDSSVDSLHNSAEWGNVHRVPLAGGEGSTSNRSGRMKRRSSMNGSARFEEEGNRSGRMQRRGSLNNSARFDEENTRSGRMQRRGSVNNRTNKKHNPFRNPVVFQEIQKEQEKLQPIAPKSSKKKSRRNSLGDSASSFGDDVLSQSERPSLIEKIRRRGSLDNTTGNKSNEALHSSYGENAWGHRSLELDLNTSFNASSSGLPLNFTSRSEKMARRGSMDDGDTARPLSQPEPSRRLGRMTRIGSMNDLLAAGTTQPLSQPEPTKRPGRMAKQLKPKRLKPLLQRLKPSSSETEAPLPQPALKRGASLDDMPLRSSMRMDRRGSMNDGQQPLSQPLASVEQVPLKSAMRPAKQLEPTRLKPLLQPLAPVEPSIASVPASNAVPLKSAMKRGSMNDGVSAKQQSLLQPLSPSEPSAPLKSAMRMPRRGSLNDSAPLMTMQPLEPSMPLKSSMRMTSRRGSMSGAGIESSSSDLSYRIVPTKFGLNDAPKTPSLHDSSSRMSYPKSALKSSLSDGPKSALKGKLTPLNDSTRSSRMSSLNDISGPPLVDGRGTAMGEGYCVPLKSMSERNARTSVTSLRGKEVEQSPLSKSERTRRLHRSPRAGSNYYSDRVSLNGSSSGMSNSLSSIPDVLETKNDSVSQLGGRPKRSAFSCDSGSDDSVTTFDTTDDDDQSLELDEMESSTRSAGIGDEIGVVSFEKSWSINNLAADLSVTDSFAASTLFPDRSQRSRTSINIPQGAMDAVEHSSVSYRDESNKLMRMEGDNWNEEEIQFHQDGESKENAYGSLHLRELATRPMTRISSLAYDEGDSLGFGHSANSMGLGNSTSSMGLDKSTKSITWEDETHGASYGEGSLGISHKRRARQSSLTWDEDSIGPGQSSKKSLTWEDDLDDGSEDGIDMYRDLTAQMMARLNQDDDSDSSLGDFVATSAKQDSDSEGSLGDFAEASVKEDSDTSMGDFVTSAAKQDSEGSLGDFVTSEAKQDSEGSMGDFVASAARQVSDSSMGDFVKASASHGASFARLNDNSTGRQRTSFARLNDSEGSLGDFAASAGSLPMKSCFKEGSSRSFDYTGSTDSDDGSDGLIRDDELFVDALSHKVESSAPAGFNQARTPRGQSDYTMGLSGKGNVPDLDRSTKSLTGSLRRSISSIPASAPAMNGSTDSFEITAEELGIYDHADRKNMKRALMNGSGSYQGSLVSCSSDSDEYAASDEFYESEDENEKRVKQGMMWGLGTMAIGAVVGWTVKLFRRATEEDIDLMDMDTIGDELARSMHASRSVCNSVLDESAHMGSDHLWGWASIGDGGASGELVLSALHLPGTETAIISAATGTAAPTATGAGAAAVATANTMAVTAAGKVGAVAVTTTTVIGNSALATGAGIGISAAGGSAGGTAGTASSVLAAFGFSGSSGSAAAVMGSTIGALAVAGTTYYSGYGLAVADPAAYAARSTCLHAEPDIQTGIVDIILDVSGMKGIEEAWGWMPFSDGEGDYNTTADKMKEFWEDLFAQTYNNITNDGCTELYERRVWDTNLTATDIDDSGTFLTTQWSVGVSCWESCPTEDPVFGADLRRMLEFDLDATTPMFELNSTIPWDNYIESNRTKVLISELDFRSSLETMIQDTAREAGWGRAREETDEEKADGAFAVTPESPEESPVEAPSKPLATAPSAAPALRPTITLMHNQIHLPKNPL